MKYLKRFNESINYYEDDINVDITSNIIDILQDLIDDGLIIECFTVGYITLKKAGVKYTENDITLSIMANGDNDIEYKTLDFKSLKPYLKRVCDYLELEGRHYVVSLQYRNRYKKHKTTIPTFGPLKQTDDFRNIGDIDENINYESISMKFKLNK